MLDGILPVSLLFFVSLSCLPTTHESVPEIIGGIFTQFWIPAQKRLRKMIYRLGKIPEFIGGRSSVEMEFLGLRTRLQTPLELRLGLVEISGLVLLESGGRGSKRNGKSEEKKSGRAFTQDNRLFPVTEKQPESE